MDIPDEAIAAAYDVSTHLDITTSDIERILEAAAPYLRPDYREANLKALAEEIATPLKFRNRTTK